MTRNLDDYTYYRVLNKRYFVEEILERMQTDVMTENGEFIGAMHQVSSGDGNSDVYYYHGDHLGSASPDWTDVQTRAYMPDPADVPCRAVGFAIQTH